MKKTRHKSNAPKVKRHKANSSKWKKGADQARNTGNIYRPQDGRNYIKLVESDFTSGYSHWLDDPDGNRVRLNCLAGNSDRSNAAKKCPVCKTEAAGSNNIDTNLKYYFNVLIGKIKTIGNKKVVVFDPEVRPMEVGPKIGGVICSYAEEILEDPDGEWEGQNVTDITQVVFKIIRSGKGLKTVYDTRHLVNPKIKINGDLTELVDLENFVKLPKMANVLAILGQGKDEEGDEEEDEFDDFEDEDEKSEDEDFGEDEDEEPEDEESEDDDDWEDEDEEIPAKPKKKSKKNKTKKKSREEELDDLEFDDEDED